MKIVGKPYSGKPNVRFDEGELEIERSATTPALYSTEIHIFTAMTQKKSNLSFNKPLPRLRSNLRIVRSRDPSL
jgi:hypothetical protein